MLAVLLYCGMLELLPLQVFEQISDTVGPSKLCVSRTMQQRVAQLEAFKGFESVSQAWEWGYFFEVYRVKHALESIFSKKDPQLSEWLYDFYHDRGFKTSYLAQTQQLLGLGKSEDVNSGLKRIILVALKSDAPLCAALLAGLLFEDGWIDLSKEESDRVFEAIGNAPKDWQEKVGSSLRFQKLRDELSSTGSLDQTLFLSLTWDYLKFWKCSPRNLRALLAFHSGFGFEVSLEWLRVVERGLEHTGYLEDVVMGLLESYSALSRRHPQLESFKERFEEKWCIESGQQYSPEVREAYTTALRKKMGVGVKADGVKYLGCLGGLMPHEVGTPSFLFEEIVRVGDQIDHLEDQSKVTYGAALVEWALLYPEGFIEGVHVPLKDVRESRRRRVLKFFLEAAYKKIEGYLEAYQRVEAELPSGAHRDLFRVSEKVRTKARVLKRRLAALGSAGECGRDSYAKQGDHDQGCAGT